MAEYAIELHANVPTPQQYVSGPHSVDYNSPFVRMIQQARALRCDYKIGGKRYPYAINVLDLLRHPECRDRLVSMTSEALTDLRNDRSCLAYHGRAGSSCRETRQASGLGTSMARRKAGHRSGNRSP